MDRAAHSLHQLGDCLENAAHGPWTTTHHGGLESETSVPIGDGRGSPDLESLMLRVEEMEVRSGAAPHTSAARMLVPAPLRPASGLGRWGVCEVSAPCRTQLRTWCHR